MEVKQAIIAARKVIKDTFEEDSITNIGLEEVDSDDGIWRITIGFSRPWNLSSGPLAALSGEMARRSYKVVTLRDADGKMLSIRDRER